MTRGTYTYIFGPVLSRRLGKSLGIDIIPFKTCTYDCIYCEQGRTTNRTSERKEYVPVEEVLTELSQFLAKGILPDFITVSGAGEPTLNSGLGDIVRGIKALTPFPVAVITNGSLLWDVRVQQDLLAADVVMPSLDAGSEALFRQLDRPVNDIPFEKMVRGLIDFRNAFPNEIWLEIMLVDGITSSEDHVRAIAEWVRQIRPDRIQINTVVRPPAETFARPIDRERLETLAALFGPDAEIIANYSGTSFAPEDTPDAERIVELLKRRPCSLREIAEALGLRQIETAKTVQLLVEQERIVEKHFGDQWFFACPGEE
ncbi:MAG: molybdenum cofactor biosynthesis protein A [Candidatus Hydrogenedentes bacterium ADurb.Bin101]|nr:MAG: molybdenum cofactor biosynthesis protein A [Candidatus Hydrogenedentes bacterium ADurb.Bin101]HOC69725.1 radical SAM protein [Candidatus Hydrogenedentota bacterium]HOH30532.1 radical SAM protein [Candidatus Hydrogenedentota bacterium]